MAALLESLLLYKVDINQALGWLRTTEDGEIFNDPVVTVQKREFVPFLLNFLRDQSSHALTHCPATPAKTPSRPAPAAQTQGFSNERRACRSLTGDAPGSRSSSSRIQLFSPASSASPGAEWEAASQPGPHCLSGISALSSPSFTSGWSPVSTPTSSERRSNHRVNLGDYVVSPPEAQQHRGRRRSGGGGGMGAGGSGRRGGHHTEEGGGRRSGRGGAYGKMIEQVSPPTVAQLNVNNLEDFPPMGSVSAAMSKPSRRINPTPVSAERPLSKPKSCFTSTPLCKPSSPPAGADLLGGALPVTLGSPVSLQEERELLKREKNKRAQQTYSVLPSSMEPCTPTKAGLRTGCKVTPETHAVCPELSKVTLAHQLDLLSQLYCTCISENLVPNIFLELFFVVQLLTSRSPATIEEDYSLTLKQEVLERGYLRHIHNCVYFAVRVLENQFHLVSHLDKSTLRLLAENERVACFSPSLREHLTQAQDTSTAKLSPSVSTFIHSVPFQPATDNRSNFSSDKAFHTFKKQRDIFYEVLREWEDYHIDPGWTFEAALGSRIRGMVNQLKCAGSQAHFARLFLKQLVQMCKGPRVNASASAADPPDADLLGMLGADSLGRLKRLEERLVQPHCIVGPCPPPSFPGHQEFFRDFLHVASCCQLNQHLKDGLCQQLLQLDEVSILGPDTPTSEGGEEGDMEQQDEKQRFSSVLLLARLLAKFLGFISFLPYQTSERPSREIQEAAVALRSKSAPVLDVCAVLRESVRRRRTILTVPWLVEFLSMLDFTGPLLLCYRTALGTLLLLYRGTVLGNSGEVCYLNKLLMLAVLGWLFQIPVIPEDMFFTSDFIDVAQLENGNTSAQGLDCIPLVDHQLLYTCCPFLGEFRKLLAAFVSGSTAKSGGIIRKITPTAAEPRDTPVINRSQQKLQVDLEQAFFHNQPPSLRRTVEFVAERVGSNCVKHMKATFVNELVEKGEKMLRDGLEAPTCSPPKLNDSICAQLCDVVMEALARAKRFCSEKSPDAIRVLLPEETSLAVLTTSENITKRLAMEKACSWLSANITALIRREWKSRFERVMKTLASPEAPDTGDTEGADHQVSLTPKRRPGSERVACCPQGCSHSGPRPSDVLIELKEILSIAVGPRADQEKQTVAQLHTLLQRAAQTLACREFLTPVSEQMLIRSTVLLACKLVSGELPMGHVQECAGGSGPGLQAELPLRPVLERLFELWETDPSSSAPLHLLLSQLTLTAVLKGGDAAWNSYMFLVKQLVTRGLLGEEVVISHLKKLSHQSLLEEFIEKQLQSLSVNAALPLTGLPQKQTVEGAT